MTCPSALTCSQYADGALPREDAAVLERHLADCAACRARVAALATESHAIGAALRAAEPTGTVSPFMPHPIIPSPLVWLCWTVLGTWAVSMAWLSLTAGATVPSWITWLAPDLAGAGIELAIGLLLNLGEPGGVLPGTLSPTVWIGLIGIGVVAACWLARRKGDRTTTLCLSVCLVAILTTAAPPSHAFEVRRDEDRVTVPADETIDDTLVVKAENVLIEGTVTGDLIALGERVTVRGHVGGTLVSISKELRLEGDVAGNVVGAAETLEIGAARLGGNVYAASRSVTLLADTHVAGNAALAANEAEVHGRIGRQLLSLAERLWVYGNVDGDLRAYGEQVDLAGSARVGGDLTAKLKSADNLRVASDATVEGETDVSTWPEKPSRYLTFEFYLGQTLKLLAAFVTGLALFYVFPTLGRTRLDDGAAVLTTGAVGAIALVATPALAVAVTLTLIGAPLGVLAFLAWLAALYAAGIITAGLIGRRLLDADPHHQVRALLLGLAILLVLVNVPLIGGLVRWVAIIVGLGLIVQSLRAHWAGRIAA